MEWKRQPKGIIVFDESNLTSTQLLDSFAWIGLYVSFEKAGLKLGTTLLKTDKWFDIT